MSHTTTISNIIVTDTQALRSAITELKRNGVNCDLLENTKPRAYYGAQSGMDQKAPFVVKLHDASYDVGMYPTEDGKGLEARTDLWGGSVEKQLGVKPLKGENAEQAKMGKLFQTYAIHATTRKAVQQGYQVNRITKNNGTVQLQIAT